MEDKDKMLLIKLHAQLVEAMNKEDFKTVEEILGNNSKVIDPMKKFMDSKKDFLKGVKKGCI